MTMNAQSDFAMTINGTSARSPATIDVINPATGEVFAGAPDCTPEQLDEAVAPARAPFQPWGKLPIEERQALLHKAGDVLAVHADELARLFTREQGRPVDGAKQEIDAAAQWLHAVAAMSPPVHISEDSE